MGKSEKCSSVIKPEFVTECFEVKMFSFHNKQQLTIGLELNVCQSQFEIKVSIRPQISLKTHLSCRFKISQTHPPKNRTLIKISTKVTKVLFNLG